MPGIVTGPDRTGPVAAQPDADYGRAGLAPDREADLLTRWHARSPA